MQSVLGQPALHPRDRPGERSHALKSESWNASFTVRTQAFCLRSHRLSNAVNEVDPARPHRETRQMRIALTDGRIQAFAGLAALVWLLGGCSSSLTPPLAQHGYEAPSGPPVRPKRGEPIDVFEF